MLAVAQRRPQHVADFLAGQLGTDSAASGQLPLLVVSPLPGHMHAVLARSGAAQLSIGFLQDAVNAAALTIWASGMQLLNHASGCVQMSSQIEFCRPCSVSYSPDILAILIKYLPP